MWRKPEFFRLYPSRVYVGSGTVACLKDRPYVGRSQLRFSICVRPLRNVVWACVPKATAGNGPT